MVLRRTRDAGVAGDDHSRRELAAFLRSHRERLSPEQAGFPAGLRRRTRGLRREEVAVLAGLSPTWYAYLEQGRRIQPSPEVLDSIARVLQLNEDERRYLHVLAYGGGQVRLDPLAADITSDDLLGQVIAVTDMITYPVYSTNSYCDLLSWNQAATEWYGDWDARSGGQPPNMLEWLMSPAARDRLADWEDEARDSVARWRAEVAHFPNDVRVRSMITEFEQLSPHFKDWWNDHDVQSHRTRLRRFQHPDHGLRTLRIVPLTSPHLVTVGLIFHVPVDGETA